jgi:catechol 2,3-dioxygenase-like lactoylglutathione lyase family enzyme
MNQRLDILTLGVADVPRARAFYERLGWQLTFTDGDIVMFQAGPMVVSLWGRDQLAADSGVDAAPDGWGGFTLGYAVDGPADVDALCERAAQAGATITRAPVEKPFGYSGVFADPDGHTWEVAWIKALARRDDGSVALPT